MIRPAFLYHGTLRRAVPSIEELGLVPMIGRFTEGVYGKDARGVVPAVFMADASGLERVVHAMVAAMMDEVTEEDFEEFRIGEEYHLNDELFFRYGAILEIEQTGAHARTGRPLPGMLEPEQAEDGDWYSLTAVRAVRTMEGDDLRDFLRGHGIVPSLVNDFVDPDTVRTFPAAAAGGVGL